MSCNDGRRTVAKWIRRLVVVVYLAMLLVIPVGLIVWRTFSGGLQPVTDALTSDDFKHALTLTLEVGISAVVLNTVFGIGVAMLLVRGRFWGKRLLSAAIDLPIAVSPVIVGLALILVYGLHAPAGGWLERHGIQIIFAVPGMVLATVFVSLPLVVRAIVPVLQELGQEQEQAAHTLGASRWTAFRRITVPSIRWALAYGIVLCLARALGEYGALAVVSGRIVGQTQTVTLYVEQEYNTIDQPGAYAAATVLALIAIVALLITKLLQPRAARAAEPNAAADVPGPADVIGPADLIGPAVPAQPVAHPDAVAASSKDLS
jgi:sulfate transport system permease protein